MNSNVDDLIKNLTPAIERKCSELRAARAERVRSRIFVLLCALAVLIPCALVFFGVSLTAMIALPLFMSVGVIFLLPVLISGKNFGKEAASYE